jgi:phosphatidylethanolamine/phosphatidyl-N-methylethanolamine N-methyltransferase
MSLLLLKRFLQRPRQVAYIVPSSRTLRKKVSSWMDLSRPRVVVEFGPGEGCHARHLLKVLPPGSRLLLIELDPILVPHLHKQFAGIPEVSIHQGDAVRVVEILRSEGFDYCDYIVSGIPFSWLPQPQKSLILQQALEALRPEPHSALITYQVSKELDENGHCAHFGRRFHEFCLANIPPMWVSVFHRLNEVPCVAATP